MYCVFFVVVCFWPTVGLPAIMLFFIQEQSGLLWVFFHQYSLQKTPRYLPTNTCFPLCFLIHDYHHLNVWRFIPNLLALCPGPVLTGASHSGHGQIWAKPSGIVWGGAGLHSLGSLSDHIVGPRSPITSPCDTDLGEALLPGHPTRRLQVKQA